MAENDIDEDIDPKREIERWTQEAETRITQFGTELRTGKPRIFFYAASDFDWQPLHRFSHIADVFVYVDPRKTEAEFGTAQQQLRNRQTNAGAGLVVANDLFDAGAAYEILSGIIGPLAEMRDEPWTHIPNLQNRPAWGAVQRLQRIVGGETRDRWLVFLGGSPLIAYQRLFIHSRTAPACLVLCAPQVAQLELGPMDAALNDWRHFAEWEGELGQMVREHQAPLPKLLAAYDSMNWPVRGIHYAIDRWRTPWRTNVANLEPLAWPELTPTSDAGARVITLARKPLNPQNARSVGAVVVDYNTLSRYRWPNGVVPMLRGEPEFPDQEVPGGVPNLNIVGIPLRQALNAVEAACVERGISSVAIQGLPGFEDELEDLLAWRRQVGQITNLTIHIDCDGHYIDYAPAADVLE